MDNRIRALRAAAAAAAGMAAIAGFSLSAQAKSAALCVGPGPTCVPTLAAAVAAARDGDTITMATGTFDGGVAIHASVEIVGAGAGRTIISGGGPVLTIGAVGSGREPTVSISGVTITDGRTKGDGNKAFGGGVSIPAAPSGGKGATVTIADSAIDGNVAAPTVAQPDGPPCPGGKPCPYAGAGGGGIDSSGTLVLRKTTVRDNTVGGPLASDAEGGGILSHMGSVTLVDSTVSGNSATAVAPNGRFADSGGVFAEGGKLTIRNSTVHGNVARLTAALPKSVDLLAIAGGIHVSDKASGSISDSTISGNSVSMTNSVGDATAFSGGVHSDGPLVLTDDTISGNSVNASTTGGSRGDASADSGAGEINGTSKVTRARFTGNSVRAVSPHGLANASAGASVSAGAQTTIRESLVKLNDVFAGTTTGSVRVDGGGFVNIGLLLVTGTSVMRNTARGSGPRGSVRGGGIWNDHPADGPPQAHLALVDSSVTHNSAKGSRGLVAQGGGIYSTVRVTLTRTRLAGNTPDDCRGC